MNTAYAAWAEQFCDSGNTLGRLIAPLAFTKTDASHTVSRKRMLLIRTHYRKHLIRDVSLVAYNFRDSVYEDSSKSRYLRVTKSKLIDRISLTRRVHNLRRKPMPTPTLKPNKIELRSSERQSYRLRGRTQPTQDSPE